MSNSMKLIRLNFLSLSVLTTLAAIVQPAHAEEAIIETVALSGDVAPGTGGATVLATVASGLARMAPPCSSCVAVIWLLALQRHSLF